MRGTWGWEFFEGSVHGDGPWTLSWTRRVNTGGSWSIIKSGGVNRRLTELSCCNGHLNECIEREEAVQDSGHLSLQKPDDVWWQQGSDYDPEVRWRNKRSLEMRRSRRMRSQDARWDICMVNISVNRSCAEMESRGYSPQWTRTFGLVIESDSRIL